MNEIKCNSEDFVEVNGKKYYARSIENTGWVNEAPEEDESYKYIGCDGTVGCTTWKGWNIDKLTFDNCNLFDADTPTDFLIDICKAQALQRKLWRWQALNDESVDFRDGRTNKYFISFSFHNNKFFVNYSNQVNQGCLVYFSSEEKAKECLNEFRDELEWYFTEFNHRLDV